MYFIILICFFSEGTHLVKFGAEGLPPLLKLFNLFPGNNRLQLLVAHTIKTLSLDGNFFSVNILFLIMNAYSQKQHDNISGGRITNPQHAC